MFGFLSLRHVSDAICHMNDFSLNLETYEHQIRSDCIET
jgi:hypothetical protein